MASKHYSPESRALLSAMSTRMIAYYPALALALDSVPAAIMLGQLLYWHGKQADPDGWIKKSAAEMEEETAITTRQQELARPILVEKGAIEYERKGVPPVGHYKINHDKIIALFLENDAPQLPQKRIIDSALHSGDQLPQKRIYDTETTQKSTHRDSARAVTNLDALAVAAKIDRMPPARRISEKAKLSAEAQRAAELETMPAVKVHREVCGIQPLSVAQMEAMVAGVNGSSETTWRQFLLDYRKGRRKDNGQPWRLDNVEAQLQGHASIAAAHVAAPATPAFVPESYDL